MPRNRTRSPARLLAPAALLAFALAVALIVLGSTGGGEVADPSETTTEERTTRSVKPSPTDPPAPRSPSGGKTYAVRPGDTLGSIAQTTGVKVEALLQLNPSLDPQALAPGQKLKLR